MREKNLVAGVIGGLGPAATIDFLRRVLELTPAETEQDHIRLLVDQNPRVPNRQQAILENGSSPGPALADMAAGLERAGADFLVMPCNTAHAFARDITHAVSIPLVSIVDSTLESVTADVRTIGVLETPACRKAELYDNALNAAGRACIRLEASDCDVLMEVAYAVKRGDYGSVQKAAARQLAESLVARGAGAIIVACNELPLVLNDKDVSVPLIVTTDALARKTIALARGDLPLPATGK